MRVQEIIMAGGQARYVVVDADGGLLLPVVKYLKYLDSVGRARNTLRTNAYALCLYFRYLHQRQLDHTTITLDDLARFILCLQDPYQSSRSWPEEPVGAAHSKSTINLILTLVTGFYDYLYRQGGLQTSLRDKTHTLLPAGSRRFKGFLYHITQTKPVEASILRQKAPKRRPKTLSEGEIERLRAACNNNRDRLLVRLLLESGMRIGEALALWIEDVQIDACLLHIRDRGPLSNGAEIKTQESCRSLHVPRNLINEIMDYVADLPEDVQTNHLFIKLSGPRALQPLSYPEVYDLFRRLERKTGIDATAHVLRHTHLTDLARNGMRPEAIQQRAGHANFQTTYQMYVHPTDEDVRAEWERVTANNKGTGNDESD